MGAIFYYSARRCSRFQREHAVSPKETNGTGPYKPVILFVMRSIVKSYADQIKVLLAVLGKNRTALEVAAATTAAMQHHDVVVVETLFGEEVFVAAALSQAMGSRIEIAEKGIDVAVSRAPLMVLSGELDLISQERAIDAKRRHNLRPLILISQRGVVGYKGQWAEGFHVLTRQSVELGPSRARTAAELGVLFAAFVGFHNEEPLEILPNAIDMAGTALRVGLPHGHDTLPRRIVDIRILADVAVKTLTADRRLDTSVENILTALHMTDAMLHFNEKCCTARGIIKSKTPHHAPGHDMTATG